ncbi:MAG TPA: universal stress protein [Myxococcota bacterium]|nr:universal stress protein [Myxococcota bacterium]
MTFRRILIAVDESAVAAHAADAGLELARAVDGEVAFVHAIDPALGRAPDTGFSAAQLVAMAEREGKELVAQFRQRASLRSPPLAFVPVGRPGAEIVKVAEDWPADVIVIGSHGRGGATRLLVGSVAESVMRHAPCPVLVVRTRA